MELSFCVTDTVVEIIRGVGTSILVCGTVSGRWHKHKSVLFCVLGHCEGILRAGFWSWMVQVAEGTACDIVIG